MLPVAVVLAVVCTGLHTPLLATQKMPDGSVPFDSTAVVFLQELLKLAACVAVVMAGSLRTVLTREPSVLAAKRHESDLPLHHHVDESLDSHSPAAAILSLMSRFAADLRAEVSIPISQLMLYALPGLLYSLNNNAAVLVLRFVDPISFQVLANFKIITTAVLYRVFIARRPYTTTQWIAFYLLMAAGALCAENMTSSDDAAGRWGADHEPYVTPEGLVVMLAYSVFSAISAVYSEALLKKQQKPLFVQGQYLF